LLMAASRRPSDSKISARFLRSASACISIAVRTAVGGVMSLISYLQH
jgi:hypothetical protein